MDKLSDIRDRIAQGSTAGKIYKAVAKDVLDAMKMEPEESMVYLSAMSNVYIEQSEQHLKDALKATEEFQEYMKNKEWRNNGTKRVSGQS